ncbi:MAG: TIGR00730 family Rossman fold protein [Bacteroidales bacterium]
MIKNICVFCSSSDALPEIYYTEAKKFARLLISENYNLIYGGARVGSMGIIARMMMEGNAHVTGVVPELIYNNNIAESNLSSLIITPDMKSRKAKMADLADAFIALPGGFGTLEELLEVITLKQLEYHQKPVVMINTNGFYDKLADFFEQLYSDNFAKSDYKMLYHIASDSFSAIQYLKEYTPGKVVSKWYKANLNI